MGFTPRVRPSTAGVTPPRRSCVCRLSSGGREPMASKRPSHSLTGGLAGLRKSLPCSARLRACTPVLLVTSPGG